MCGIAGIINPLKVNEDRQSSLTDRLQQMINSLAHRGPDKQGVWMNPQAIAGLGHCRLSIIDLSDAASQPMSYLGRYTIIHNGEIYNYIEVREDLQQKGYSFTSLSDTEKR